MPTLKTLRDEKGLSRAKVAADLDMSERHLQRLEAGNTPLRRILAFAFADYYGVDIEDIDQDEVVA